MDRRLTLERLSMVASTYKINLDAEVYQEPIRSPSCGRRALVYRGRMHQTGKKVAIKALRCVPPIEEQSITRILREVYVWTQLHHENVVPVFGVATTVNFSISLISDWMDMGNAIDHVQRREVDPRPLLLDIANGLRYLHEQTPAIIHGDLRGKNVMISQGGRALLIDYGVAQLVDSTFDNSVGGSSYDPSWIRWMAPETMEHGRDLNIKDDIWAFGMTALELFTRRPPFYDIQGINDVIARIATSPPDHPGNQVTRDHLTDGWWNICHSCWSRILSQRPSMSDVLRMIEGNW
ncbi:kinase-like domain-containing protein [Scleroderma yunnanense]